MKKSLLCIVVLSCALPLFAQQKVTLTIRQLLGTEPFVFNKAVKNNLNQDFNISRVNYYLSSIKLIHDGGKITAVPDKYIFVNGKANIREELGSFPVTKVEGIQFSVGVEAPANNDDPAKWTGSHPLAPKSPSMHWGWSAGYRFVALEGKAGASLTTTYEMHGLGNHNYFSQTVTGVGNAGTDGITVDLNADYTGAVYGIDLASGPIDHGVDATDLAMLKNFQSRVFSPNAEPNALAEVQGAAAFTVYPNPSSGSFHIASAASVALEEIIVTDITGRVLQQTRTDSREGTEIRIDQKGIYLLRLTDSNKRSSYQKLIVR
ncbi:MAG TPA: MbnP family protein [Chitinophagaceae bacterium]|nr:MbnP family protein [Chitinophagaceae bacterium]